MACEGAPDFWHLRGAHTPGTAMLLVRNLQRRSVVRMTGFAVLGACLLAQPGAHRPGLGARDASRAQTPAFGSSTDSATPTASKEPGIRIAVAADERQVPRPDVIKGALVEPDPCEQIAHTSAESLVGCIRAAPLRAHLVAFQAIADANPGADGQRSRHVAEPGHLASALYVAERMAAVGYSVQLQQYTVPYFNYRSVAHLERVSPGPVSYAVRTEWYPATYSGSGDVTAIVQPTLGMQIPAPATPTNTSGCSAASFSGFVPGRIALVQRGGCSNYTKVHNAELAGAAGVIIFNDGGNGRTAAFRASISPTTPVGIPVVLVQYAIGLDFRTQYLAGNWPTARVDVQTVHEPQRPDYNVIAESPLGDPNHVIVIEGHLDAIYGAGILDNASGSATILEIGLKMARTPTLNRLRYVWFGGEELGLYGSQHYVNTLSDADAARIEFAMNADVTATPNHVTALFDPTYSASASQWSQAHIQASQRGTNYFGEYFQARGLPYIVRSNDNTDSWSFSWRGIPNTGIHTGQNCCKTQAQVDMFGGTLGNYEGTLGSTDGGFVHRLFSWADNLDNTDPSVHEATSRAFAYVAWKLANDPALSAAAQPAGLQLDGKRARRQSSRTAVIRPGAGTPAQQAARAAIAQRHAIGPDR
jgi:Zn-dependent M28 family amino/carboxypeptidase